MAVLGFLLLAGCQKNNDIEPSPINPPEEPPEEEIVDYGLDTLGKWTWLDYGEEAGIRGTTSYLMGRIPCI